MAKRQKTPASRLIDNEIYKDERFVALENPLVQLAYVAALGQVDTFANLTADPRRLRLLVLPHHNLSEEEICYIFDKFAEVGLVFFYRAKKDYYVHFVETAHRLYSPPVCPLPEGLTARKPEKEGKARYTSYRIYDEAGNECDADGEPLDPNVERVAAKWCENMPNMQCIFNEYAAHTFVVLNRKERNRNEMNISFLSTSLSPDGSGARGAAASGDAAPAPGAEVAEVPAAETNTFFEELK